MMRQLSKQILTLIAWGWLSVAAPAAGLVTTIVTDPLTGIAIDGYDPVSYFIEAEPQPGLAAYEYVWGGVPWYFVSAANRDVFIRNPEVYAPQFGGHCLTSLSRGYLSDGKARLYAIDALKLYLFYSAANRDAFLLSRSSTLETATTQWNTRSGELIGVAGAEPAAPAEAPFADAAPSANDASH